MSAGNPKGYENPNLLWTPAELHERLGHPNLRIIDVRPGERFAMGHIPGACHFDIYGVNTYDTDEAPLNSFVRMWAFLLGRHGVSFENTIVFCGEIAGMTSARGFWFLEFLGHSDTHVLDGGYTAWVGAGLPVTRDAEVPKPKSFKYSLARERVATYRDMLGAIDDPHKCILDTRSKEEWLGMDVRAARGGAVPSAVHQDWVNHLTREGEMKPANELRTQFEGLGVTRDKDIIPYCNTGYRSAHAYLALRLLGYQQVRNYVGSWQEWANRPELPVIVPDR
ncbi:MAG: sulfurtransferase [Acidiferrobacterales bacterium]